MPRLHLTPGKDPVPIVQEAGWDSGLVRTGAENLAPPGFDLWTVQPVGSRYTDYVTVCHKSSVNNHAGTGHVWFDFFFHILWKAQLVPCNLNPPSNWFKTAEPTLVIIWEKNLKELSHFEPSADLIGHETLWLLFYPHRAVLGWGIWSDLIAYVCRLPFIRSVPQTISCSSLAW